MSARSRGGMAANERRGAARIASGARNAPYARPGGPSRQTSLSKAEGASGNGASPAWPPNQISIKGASGPTWVIVANLVNGVSEADIRETLQQFGQIEGIKTRKPPTENHTSQAFEIAFTYAESAKTAIEKLHGALADGRVLQVFLRDEPKKVLTPTTPTAPAKASTAQRELLTSLPQASSKAAKSRPAVNEAAAKRDLLLGRGTSAGNGKRNDPSSPSVPLQSRILSAQELKALKRQQSMARSVPAGHNQPSAASLALAKRIGSLPLAQRLATQSEQAAPKSSAKAGNKGGATAAGSKKQGGAVRGKKSKKGMDVDA